MKKIKLMADYHCYPVWDLSGPYRDIDPDELPISDNLKSRLMEWARTYDGILNMDDPAASDFETPEARRAFEACGRHLAEQLQKELGPDFLVSVYLSES
ncbi:CdiI immunity protein domain-containing protein [Bordetella sputigena]|uniref:hypothetical protein n=1 Tax=Bordetella sputigena TaxID=1416810 RepID=UPI0039F100F8